MRIGILYLLIILLGPLQIFLYHTYFGPKVYTVDVVEIIDGAKREIARSRISDERKMMEMVRFLKSLEKALSEYDGPVLISQSVVGGRYHDITEEVRRKVRELYRLPESGSSDSDRDNRGFLQPPYKGGGSP